jgi:uncharacterized cofD-like protein
MTNETTTPTPARGPKIVVIGGGTGTFTILSALKYYARDITAVVNMSDDGGSTGILRDELGALPPGDIRQCLVALSESDQVMRDLFNYRFEEGTFGGHSFGNIFLTALEKTTGSFASAVKTAGEVLKITGHVVPVTLNDVKLVLTRTDETTVVGQYAIETSRFASAKPELSLNPTPTINPEATAAIAEADMVIIAPGNLYATLAPALIVPGMPDALQKTKATIIYAANLVTKPGQTDGFEVQDYANEIERFIGRGVLDYVIYNTHKPSKDLLDKYAQEGEFAVEYDLKEFDEATYRPIGADVISDTIYKPGVADQKFIPRTLIRHDSDKLARLIMRIYFS